MITTSELDALGKPYKIYAEVLEPGAIAQFLDCMSHPAMVQGAVMPDAHQGYGLCIGGVVASEDMVFPSFVGYDIGCGMVALPTSFNADDVRENAQAIFDGIYKAVPTGFAHNQHPIAWDNEGIPRTDLMQGIFDKNGLRQLGSLGGGNHFIEIGADATGKVWIVTHSGSRGIGHTTATHHMKLASGDGHAREGVFGFAVSSQEGKDYITDLNFCLAFALANRREIVRRVEGVLVEHCAGGGLWADLINRNHNHAELVDGLWVHRKGATQAAAGMMGVIPGNMRDGSFIVRGKGNPDSLWSSSHGAGRVLGRKEAQRTLNMENFAESMQGITALVEAGTLDEAPGAYKNIEEVMELQSDLVEVVARVRPIINIKAKGENNRHKKPKAGEPKIGRDVPSA